MTLRKSYNLEETIAKTIAHQGSSTNDDVVSINLSDGHFILDGDVALKNMKIIGSHNGGTFINGPGKLLLSKGSEICNVSFREEVEVCTDTEENNKITNCYFDNSSRIVHCNIKYVDFLKIIVDNKKFEHSFAKSNEIYLGYNYFLEKDFIVPKNIHIKGHLRKYSPNYPLINPTFVGPGRIILSEGSAIDNFTLKDVKVICAGKNCKVTNSNLLGTSKIINIGDNSLENICKEIQKFYKKREGKRENIFHKFEEKKYWWKIDRSNFYDELFGHLTKQEGMQKILEKDVELIKSFCDSGIIIHKLFHDTFTDKQSLVDYASIDSKNNLEDMGKYEEMTTKTEVVEEQHEDKVRS